MAAKKRKFPEIELTPEHIADVIYKANKPVKLDDILAMLKVKRNSKRDVEFLLQALELDGRLIRSRGTWFPPKNRPLAQGVLSIQRSGAGFVIPEEAGKGDIFIAPLDLKDAWDGDIVEVAIMPHRQGPSREGRITRIIERSQKLLPAFAMRKQGNEWLATPQHSGLQVLFSVDVSEIDNKRSTPVLPTYALPDSLSKSKLGDLSGDLSGFLPDGLPNNSPDNLAKDASAEADKGFVKEIAPVKEDDLLLIMPLEKLGPGLWSAKAVMNLYSEESPAAQELLAKIGHGIPMEFPPAVMKEVASMPEDPIIDEGITNQRKDLRDVGFVTIDGADAKDFDDAVYVEKTAKGYRLLVAIADVSYYVANSSAIDNEARRRGNSYYFPLSVEPMLPEVLSNGLCSLKPKAPRLAVVAEMFFSDKGVETSASFCTAIVESKARLTYSQVHAAAVEKNIEMQKVLQAHMPMLDEAFALASLLGRNRSHRGSLDFDLPEAQFVFDEHGEVSAIVPRKSTKANNLIEEFMIAANEAVARFLTDKKRYLLYRVHEAPDMEKLEALKNFILQTHLIDLPQGLQGAGNKKAGRGSRHGFTQKKTESLPPSPQEFKAILQAARGTPQEYTVNRLLLRAMMQARYSPENLGHFGLASTCYCHFTSPIRRYADLVVHRALKAALGLRESVSQEHDGKQVFKAGQEGGSLSADKKMRLERAPQTVWVKEKEAVKGVSFEGVHEGTDPETSSMSEILPMPEETGLPESPQPRKDARKKSGRSASSNAPKARSSLGGFGELTIQRLEDIAEHINSTERSAMEAERETHKRLAALYLQNHVGEEFDGVVSGVTDFGIFVELTSCLSEGMVRLSSLDDDYYHYLQDRQMLRGERTGRKFTIGLPVRVEVIDVSLQRFEVTLAILPEEGEAGGNGKKRGESERRGGAARRTRDDHPKGRGKKESPRKTSGKVSDKVYGKIPSKEPDKKPAKKPDKSQGKPLSKPSGKIFGQKTSSQDNRSKARGAEVAQNDDIQTQGEDSSFEGKKRMFKKPELPIKSGRKTQRKNIASKQKKKR